MGINVVNIGGLETGVFEGVLHGASGAVAFGVGLGDMVGVGGHAVAQQFGVDSGAARFGMLQRFQNQHAASFAHHKAVALGVKRAAGVFRVVVAGGHRPRGAERANPHGHNRRLRTARNHHIRIAVNNRPHRLTHRVRPGGACRYHAQVRSLNAKLN